MPRVEGLLFAAYSPASVAESSIGTCQGAKTSAGVNILTLNNFTCYTIQLLLYDV